MHGEKGKDVTADTCEICGAADPKWIRWVDRSAVDYAWRTMLHPGYPGPTALAVKYCEKPECEFEVIRRYGAPGNENAKDRLLKDLLARIQEQK